MTSRYGWFSLLDGRKTLSRSELYCFAGLLKYGLGGT